MQWRRKITTLSRILLATALATAAIVLVFRLPFMAALEHLAEDARVAHLQPAEPQHDSIVILAIDEATLRTLPWRSPVHRGFLADLVTLAGERGARALGIDIIFDGPSDPALDRRLAAALDAAPMPVVLAAGGIEAGLDETQLSWQAAWLDGRIAASAQLIGDPLDNIVRRQRVIDPGREPVISFAGALARELGAPLPEGDLAIRYRPPTADGQSPFAIYPAHAAALLPPDWLADRIVLVGAVLADGDRHAAPISRDAGDGAMPGIVIQAHMLAQLLDGARLPRPPLAAGLLIIAGMAAAGAIIGSLRAGLGWRIAGGLALLVVWWLAALWGYRAGGWLVPLMAPTLALPLAGTLVELAGGREARRQRRFIRTAFDRYLAPEVVARLVEDPSSLKLGGERREISLVFTDLAGFTSISETLPPERMADLLNDYLEQMMQIVLDHGGTIDKLVGDALHAFFGAPHAQPDHAERAIACALDLDAAAEAMRIRLNEAGVPWGVTRIGVHRGPAVVGNFGGRQRFDYTAYGDVVNTTARLESVNKQLGTRLCLSAKVASAAPDLPWRPVGSLRLVGRSRPLPCVEPALPGLAPIAAYAEAWRALEACDTALARVRFDALAMRYPEDGLVAFHLARLQIGGQGTVIELAGK